MMTKEQLINLVANDVHAREHVESPSHHHGHDVSEDQWFDISDASVFQLDKKSVLQKEAYLLFYERVAWQLTVGQWSNIAQPRSELILGH